MSVRMKEKAGFLSVVVSVAGVVAATWLWAGTILAQPHGSDAPPGPVVTSDTYVLECAAITFCGGSLRDESDHDRGFAVIGQAAAGLMTGPGYTLEAGIIYCLPIPGDLENDKDVDGFDFLTFSNCFNGSEKPPMPACENLAADLDYDGDVDGFDFLTFANCYNGAGRTPRCR